MTPLPVEPPRPSESVSPSGNCFSPAQVRPIVPPFLTFLNLIPVALLICLKPSAMSSTMPAARSGSFLALYDQVSVLQRSNGQFIGAQPSVTPVASLTVLPP